MHWARRPPVAGAAKGQILALASLGTLSISFWLLDLSLDCVSAAVVAAFGQPPGVAGRLVLLSLPDMTQLQLFLR